MRRSRRTETSTTRLRKGTAFHHEVQTDYAATAEGSVTREKPITKPTGRSGRMDLHVRADDRLDACIEIKQTDWDRMRRDRIRPNALRHARQVWGYVEPLLDSGREVSPAVIYSRAPRSSARRREIEAILNERMISVVWRTP